MARPKDTRTTKWRIAHESWHETRRGAIIFAKTWGGPTEIQHMPYATTQWGNLRRAKWRLREFAPTVYRGREVMTNVVKSTRAIDIGKYHKKHEKVKIRGGGYVYLGDRVTHARRKKGGRKKRK